MSCFELLFSQIIKKIIKRGLKFYFLVLMLMIMMTSLFWFLSKVLLFFSQLSPSPTTSAEPAACKKASKNKFVLSSARDLQTSNIMSPLVQTDNDVVQKFDARKIYKISNEVIFFAPFFVCFSLFTFKLGATAILCLRNWFMYQTGNKKLTGC